MSRSVAAPPSSTVLIGWPPASITIGVSMNVAGCSALTVTAAGSSSAARSSVNMIWASLLRR